MGTYIYYKTNNNDSHIVSQFTKRKICMYIKVIFEVMFKINVCVHEEDKDPGNKFFSCPKFYRNYIGKKHRSRSFQQTGYVVGVCSIFLGPVLSNIFTKINLAGLLVSRFTTCCLRVALFENDNLKIYTFFL